MFNKEGFNLKKPDLIISVTGGAKTLALDEKTSYAFKTGLMKVANGNNAWIVSGGTDAGVMRLVGDAVAEEFQYEDVPVIGIATWGVIYNESKNVTKCFLKYLNSYLKSNYNISVSSNKQSGS